MVIEMAYESGKQDKLPSMESRERAWKVAGNNIWMKIKKKKKKPRKLFFWTEWGEGGRARFYTR